MILEGNERGNGAELAQHLMNARDNEHVSVHAIDGFVADDLFGAFAEVEAIAAATQCLTSAPLGQIEDLNKGGFLVHTQK